MKILLLSRFDFTKKIIPENINNQMQMYLYHIVKYLKQKDDVELLYKYYPPVGKKNKQIYELYDVPKADHVIVIEQRGIIKRPLIFYNILRKKISGAICTFSTPHKPVGDEDVLFYFLPEGKGNKKKCKLIHWAANPDLCKPKKDPNLIRILIDHSYYGKETTSISKNDQSKNIIESICKFAKEYKDKDKDIIIRRFISGGVETVNIDNPYIEKYNRKGLSYKNACEEYSKADIFIVTHQECMGWSIIESAMAGALIVSSEGINKVNGNRYNQINKILLKKLHHIKYFNEKDIPWNKIINSINSKKSREMAMNFTWEKTVNRIYDTLKNFDYYKNEKNLCFNNRHR